MLSDQISVICFEIPKPLRSLVQVSLKQQFSWYADESEGILRVCVSSDDENLPPLINGLKLDKVPHDHHVYLRTNLKFIQGTSRRYFGGAENVFSFDEVKFITAHLLAYEVVNLLSTQDLTRLYSAIELFEKHTSNEVMLDCFRYATDYNNLTDDFEINISKTVPYFRNKILEHTANLVKDSSKIVDKFTVEAPVMETPMDLESGAGNGFYEDDELVVPLEILQRAQAQGAFGHFYAASSCCAQPHSIHLAFLRTSSKNGTGTTVKEEIIDADADINALRMRVNAYYGDLDGAQGYHGPRMLIPEDADSSNVVDYQLMEIWPESIQIVLKAAPRISLRQPISSN